MEAPMTPGKYVVAEFYRYETTGPDERVLVLVGPNMGYTLNPRAEVETIQPWEYDTQVEAEEKLRSDAWPGCVLQIMSVSDE
jgi:hypothetical protein